MEKINYLLKWLKVNKITLTGTMLWLMTELVGLFNIFDKLQGLEYAQWLAAMIALIIVNVLIVKGLFGLGLEDPDIVGFLKEEVSQFINNLDDEVTDESKSETKDEVTDDSESITRTEVTE